MLPACIRLPAVALAVLSYALIPAAAQAPMKTYTVELEAEKDYFAPDMVRVTAVSRASGQVQVGEFDVTIRRQREISVPADTSELVFRTGKDIAARLRLTAKGGTIVVPSTASLSRADDMH